MYFDSGFELKGDTLIVRGELGASELAGFGKALRDLVAATDDVPTLDLSSVNYMSSSYIGHVARAMVDLQDNGRKLRIVASRRVMRILKLGGIDKLGDIVEAH